jgi:hypothetical protein
MRLTLMTLILIGAADARVAMLARINAETFIAGVDCEEWEWC